MGGNETDDLGLEQWICRIYDDLNARWTVYNMRSCIYPSERILVHSICLYLIYVFIFDLFKFCLQQFGIVSIH